MSKCTANNSPGITVVDPSQEGTPSDTTEDTGIPQTFGQLHGGTCCDSDRIRNVWIEGGDPNTGVGGVCMLDNLYEGQVVDILSRDERARADLLKVTSNARLRELAITVPRLPTGIASDQSMKELNRGAVAGAFYSQFRGNPPFSQGMP